VTNIPAWLVLVGDALSVASFVSNVVWGYREHRLNVAAASATRRLSGEAERAECRNGPEGYCRGWAAPHCLSGYCGQHCRCGCRCK
jgi:hypothetical protein